MTGPGGLGTGVERFTAHGTVVVRPEGEWVRHADYAALEAECARLRGKVEEVRALFDQSWHVAAEDVLSALDRA